MSQSISIMLFRQDLRLSDNPALAAAREFSEHIVPVYIFDADDPCSPGAAQCWWLHYSLQALSEAIKARGGRLIFRLGNYQQQLKSIVKETKASAVFWNRCYEPYAIKRDMLIKKALGESNVEVFSFCGSLLNEPWTVKNKQGNYFKVFTPYWRAVRAAYEDVKPLPIVRVFKTPRSLKTDKLESWGFLPSQPDWAIQFKKYWQPGEAGAKKQLSRFLSHALVDYEKRDCPSLDVTSRLSPSLHFGEISPRQLWCAVKQRALHDRVSEKTVDKFLSELGWREFSYYLLYHFPQLPKKNFQAKFDNFSWKQSAVKLKRWQQGETGYPIVDAGMKELWETGIMHNRVRMITASFLIKDLLIDWRKGAAWFWDTLLDADLANNSASWQWVAGSGADASPYFRIFNPMLQGKKFDPQGRYVRHWLPALKNLPDKYIHQPWEAPTDVLDKAGVELGLDYPKPIVDHRLAREQALAAYKKL